MIPHQNLFRDGTFSAVTLIQNSHIRITALALLVSLSACSSSEPELSFSDSFIQDHNFTVALNVAGDGLDISFTAQNDASYDLSRSSVKNCSGEISACTDYLDFTITSEGAYSDSLPERTYYYKLAVSLPGISENFSAQYPPLDPPSSVTASAGDQQITLSWRGVSGASNYSLYGARVSGVTPNNYSTLEGGFTEHNLTSPHVLDGLTNGATYYLVLTAINADGVASTYSDEVSATPVTSASNNSAPVFTSASTATTSENSIGVFYTAAATDANADLISYSIKSGADASLFALDTASGALSFVNSPDYENPRDNDSDNLYQVSLIASDGVDESAALDLTVSVSDLSEWQIDYGLAEDEVIIDYALSVDTPDGALTTLYRADEPIGTSTCSVIDGISDCTNGTFWIDDFIPRTDTIDWDARRYYQLDVSVDGAIVDRLFADVSVGDYLTMNELELSSDDTAFNLSWQALTNASSYSLYISTDANATGALEANWSSLDGSQIIDAIAEANYSLDPDGASSLYLALRATNASGVTTSLSPLYQLNNIDYARDIISDSSTWVQLTNNANWTGRSEHASAVFNDKLWVLGGYDGNDGYKSDVWHSEDGVTWELATEDAGWSPRRSHASVVFEDKLWVIGGYDGDDNWDANPWLNDVWYSADGVNWTRAVANADWSERYAHTSEVFDKKIWILGGYDGSHKDDVWYSVDGINWTLAVANTNYWSGRYDHTSVVFDGKLWVLGGYNGSYEDDVWYSADGVTWEQAINIAGWSGRSNHTSVVFANNLWVIGGWGGSLREDAVWYSADGVNWEQSTTTTDPLRRYAHASTVFDEKLWVFGGQDNDGNIFNDVWYYQNTTINTFAFTPLDYDYAPPQNQVPTFTSTTSAATAENKLAAYSALADDPDDGALAYAITGGADAELFSIDSSSGDLSFLAAPDYEDPADSNTDNNYELDLQVSDGSAESELNLVVSVSDVNEDLSAPAGLQASTSSGILSLSWQIVDAAESYRVYWDTSSGVGSGQHLGTLSADNNSATISGLSDETTYYFVVTSVNDQGESVESEQLKVLISASVDNSSPFFTSIAPAEVSENTVGVFYTANVDDTDDDELSLAISGGADADLFSLDHGSGELRFREAPDYETPADSDADNNYVLTLSVADAYATALQAITFSVTDMAANANFQVEYNADANSIDIGFNTESGLSYQLLRSYDDDCDYQLVSACNGGVELNYVEVSGAATATDSIDFTQTQYYQLLASDSAGRTEVLDASIDGAEQLEEFAAAHQLLVVYNPTIDRVDIEINSFPDTASYALYRAEEPIGTNTCSILDGISSCTNGASWSNTAIPSTDTIDWSARNYYQLDISVDGTVIDRLIADIAVSDYLTMVEPTVSADGSQLDLSWQALTTNLNSYSLYLSPDADATSATKANWLNLADPQVITNITSANYSLNPDGADSLYAALAATNNSGETTSLSPLELLTIDYKSDGSNWSRADGNSWAGRRYHTSVVFDGKLWVLGGSDVSERFNDVWYSEDGATWLQAPTSESVIWSELTRHSSVVFRDRLWVMGGYDGSYQDDVWYSDDGVNWTRATDEPGWSRRLDHTSVVFDGKLWVLGGYDNTGAGLNDVWYSEDGVTWLQAPTSVVWPERYDHSSVVFDDKLWVFGGYDGSNHLNDVWYSSDGVNWTQVEDANWSERHGHTSVVFDDKLWVIGGNDNGYEDDAWYSEDGVNWTQATGEAAWSGRFYHTSVVFDNKLWVLGGYDSGYEDDAWYSEDGVNWKQAMGGADWSERGRHSSAVFDDKLWVLGGYDGSNRLNDVWYSDDGANWIQATASAAWSPRDDHSSVVFDNKLWVIGGYDGGYEDDAWYSSDGISWSRATANAAWSARDNHSSVVFDNKLWVIGGYSSSYLNDVWYSSDGTNWTNAVDSAGWPERNRHASVVFDDKLWVLGGRHNASSRLNDVWYSSDGASWASTSGPTIWSERSGHTSVVFDSKLWVLGGYAGSSNNEVWHSEDGSNWTELPTDANWSGRYDHTSVVFDDELWVLGGYNGSYANDVWYTDGGSDSIKELASSPLDYDYASEQNQAPAFTSATSAIVDENAIAAYNATGTDPDGGKLAFTIVGGADAALFAINSSSGELSFIDAPDHEQPRDSDADNIYQVDLGIHDGSAHGADLSVAITVINLIEFPTTPVGVQAAAGNGEASLSWQAVNDASSYRVYWSTNSDLSLSNFSDRQDTSSNSATISNLSNGTIYYFFVTAVNNLGESAESSVVSVKPQSGDTNQAPTAEAGADQTVSEGKTVYLVGSGSDADGSIAQYTWSSASSSISIVDSDSSDGNASFIAPEVDASGGSFTLTLRVTDDDDASGLDTMTVTVDNNEAPTVNAGVDQSAVAGTTVNLKGSASDSDGSVVAYSWQETSASSTNSGGVSISRNDSATASITVPELDAGEELTFELAATDDDGATASAQTKVTVAANGSFKWSFTTGGSIYSSPAIALDGSIYFGSDDRKLYALNPDGSEDWNYTTGGMVRSAPAIGADGSIYFGSNDNKLYALNPDGSENWNYPTGGVVRSSPALAADGSIYFGSADGKLYSLNPDGSEDWNYTSGSAIHSAPTISSEGMIYFGDSAGVVHELNSSGDLQRSFASAGAIYMSVALDPANDQLYFSNRNGNIYALSTSSAASWDSSLWSFAANNLDSAPVVAEDGTIYIGSFGDARLNALAADGTILSDKLYRNSGAIDATATLGADARIYFSSLSSGDGNISALDISSATETKLDWQYDIGWNYVEDAPAASAVAIARDGTVYVGSTDGKLYALHSASAGLAASSWPRFGHDNHNLGRINISPSAEAGNDQIVVAGAMVNLDGSSSSDPDGAIVDYYWRETSGYDISILNNNDPQASFIAPTGLSSDAILKIEITVTDNSGASAIDTLEVEVLIE